MSTAAQPDSRHRSNGLDSGEERKNENEMTCISSQSVAKVVGTLVRPIMCEGISDHEARSLVSQCTGPLLYVATRNSDSV